MPHSSALRLGTSDRTGDMTEHQPEVTEQDQVDALVQLGPSLSDEERRVLEAGAYGTPTEEDEE
jgi:hypothetical protein